MTGQRGSEKTPAGVPYLALAFCEPSNATVYSKTHIRVIGAEGRKYGGGALPTVLCGYDIRRGWDLPNVIDAEMVERALAVADDRGRPGMLCRDCGEEALSLLRPASLVAAQADVVGDGPLEEWERGYVTATQAALAAIDKATEADRG